MRKKDEETRRTISHHIFNTSATMIGVAITVVTLFRVTEAGAGTMGDELVVLDAMMFAASAFLSFLALRNPAKERWERAAAVFFVLGMMFMVLVGAFFVASQWSLFSGVLTPRHPLK